MFLKEFLHKHTVEIVGGVTGSGTSVVAMIKGTIPVSDDVHAIAMALLTGAAGGLGALVVKDLYHRIFKTKRKEE